MVKIILIWLTCLITISILIGEIEYQKSKRARKVSAKENKFNNNYKFENINFIPTFELKSRNSWRFSNGYIMGNSEFQQLKEIEYNEKL